MQIYWTGLCQPWDWNPLKIWDRSSAPDVSVARFSLKRRLCHHRFALVQSKAFWSDSIAGNIGIFLFFFLAVLPPCFSLLGYHNADGTCTSNSCRGIFDSDILLDSAGFSSKKDSKLRVRVWLFSRETLKAVDCRPPTSQNSHTCSH